VGKVVGARRRSAEGAAVMESKMPRRSCSDKPVEEESFPERAAEWRRNDVARSATAARMATRQATKRILRKGG
jgi:hypothetical protein